MNIHGNNDPTLEGSNPQSQPSPIDLERPTTEQGGPVPITQGGNTPVFIDEIVASEDEAVGSAGPIDPENPALPAPRPAHVGTPRLPGEPVDDDTGEVAVRHINEFFSPSFIAVFADLFTQLFNMRMKTGFLESQMELKQRDSVMDIAKTNAELTKEAYETQAEQKRMEAVMAFTSAALNGISALSMMGAIKKAGTAGQKEFDQNEKQVVAERDKHKAEIEKLTGMDVLTGKPKATATVASGPGGVASPPGPRVVTDPTEKIALKNAEDNYKLAKDKYDKMQMDKSDIISAKTHDEYRKTADMNTAVLEMTKSMNTGIMMSIQAGLTSQEGQIRALRDLNEGIKQAAELALNNAGKSRDEIRSDIDQLKNFMMELIKNAYLVHSKG